MKKPANNRRKDIALDALRPRERHADHHRGKQLLYPSRPLASPTVQQEERDRLRAQHRRRGMQHHALLPVVRRRVVDLALLRLSRLLSPHLMQTVHGLWQSQHCAVGVMDARHVVLRRKRTSPHARSARAPLALLRQLRLLLEEEIARVGVLRGNACRGDAVELEDGGGAEAHLHLEGLQVQIEGLQEEGERQRLVGPHLLQCLRGGHEIGPAALAPRVVARQGVEIAAAQAQRVVVVEKLRLSPRANQHVEAAGEQRVRGGVLQHGRGDRHLVGLQKGEEPRQVGVVRELHRGVHHQHVLGGDGRGGAEGERDGRCSLEDLGGGGQVVGLNMKERMNRNSLQVDLLQRIPLVETTLKVTHGAHRSIDSEGNLVVRLQLPHRIMIVTSTFMFA